MNDPTRRPATDPLAPLYGRFPGWECWVGILYARWRKSTPPIVVRATTAAELAAKIREHQSANAD